MNVETKKKIEEKKAKSKKIDEAYKECSDQVDNLLKILDDEEIKTKEK